MSRSRQSPKEKEKKEFLLSSPRFSFEKLAFYLLILLLPVQLGKHFWPSFSSVLGIRIDYLSPTLYLTDILIFVLLILWLKRQNFKNLLTILAKKWVWLIFLIYLAINIFINSPLLGLYGLIKVLELIFLGAYVARNINTKKDLKIIALLFAVSIIGESLLAIAQYVHQGSIDGLFYFLGERTFTGATPGIANASVRGSLILRPYATFSHPNVLAGFLLCSLILVYSFLESKFSLSIKIFKSFALVIGSIALLLSLSRIAIVIWFTLVIALLILKFKNQFEKTPAVLILSSIFVVITTTALLYFTPVLPRLESSSLTENSLIQRTELFDTATVLIMQSPFFGAGLYNFIPASSLIQKPFSSIRELQPVHNVFLLILAETGLIGFTFAIFFLIKTLTRLFRSHTPAGKVLLIILSVIIILGQFDHYWLTLQQGQLLLSLILGLAWAL